MPKVRRSVGLDTEVTGVDIRHGAKPYFVTTCNEEGVVKFWEFDVNPITREPFYPLADINEIKDTLGESTELVLQNTKFDYTALSKTDSRFVRQWDWSKVRDTLVAAHLLASNRPKDLTSLVLVWLGINIEPVENLIKEHTTEARKLAKLRFPEWKLAKEGLPEMPSVKSDGDDQQKPWKNDMWLPRALALELGYPDDHPWYHSLRDYANTDSSVLNPLHNAMIDEIRKRGLEEIYLERLKLLRVTCLIEDRGVTLSAERTSNLFKRFSTEAGNYKSKCIVSSGNRIEELPINGVSNALKEVIFDHFKLESPKLTDKGNPSLDKNVLDHWSVSLPEGSPEQQFVVALRQYRRRKTALSYLESYQKFWLESELGCKVLFPSLNMTGTDTLRWSSSNPNEQQIGKQQDVNTREAFGPAEGREWWSCDAENIELRIPAYEAGEQAMIDLFERPKDPPYFGSNHLLNAHILHPDLFEACINEQGELDGRIFKSRYKSSWYQWTKNGNFAVQYGAVAISGTADAAYHVPGGQALIEERLVNIKALSKRLIAFAEDHGYVETMPDREVNPERGYPLLCTRTKWGSILATVPLSYHVQGTAMWWMMKAMIRVQEFFDYLNSKSDDGYFTIMQVHDELVFDFPKRYQVVNSKPVYGNLPIIREVQRLMSLGGNDIGVPISVNAEYHPVHWGEGITV